MLSNAHFRFFADHDKKRENNEKREDNEETTTLLSNPFVQESSPRT